MSEATASSRSGYVVLAAALALLAAMWFATQGALLPPAPESPAVFVYGSLFVVLFALPYLLALWIGIAGWGWLARRLLFQDAEHGFVLQLGAGLGLMLMLDWLLAWAGLLNAATAWGLCAAGVALLAWQSATPRFKHIWKKVELPAVPWPVILAMPALGVLLVASACPPSTLWAVEAYGYDATSYHLQVPREWIDAGRMIGLEHNSYSYLPSLVEVGYAQIGWMHGSLYAGLYTTQLFHASTALLAAAAVGAIVSRFTNRTVGAIAGACVLAVPWTIITGSLAYNEMTMLALGACGFVAAFDRGGPRWGAAAAAGFLAGTATLAKLPAGPMIALPIGLTLLLDLARRDADPPSWVKRAFVPAAIAGAVGVLVLLPYFVRNAVWTGNPVFPFLTEQLGRGHWTPEEAQRWSAGHGAVGGMGERVRELGRHWAFNTGYGAVLGRARAASGGDYRNVATFREEWGVPVLWIVAGVGAVMGLKRSSSPASKGGARGGISSPSEESRTLPLPLPKREGSRDVRRLTIAMLITLGVQVVFWLFGTHLQSRFLIPSLIPGGVLAGLAVAAIPSAPWSRVAGAAVVAVLTLASYHVFFQQALRDPVTGELARPYQIVDTLAPIRTEPRPPEDVRVGDHPINDLPPGSKTLLVADVSRLFFLQRDIVYNHAFDPNPLGAILRETGGDPRKVTAALKGRGVTHVWIHWQELNRLHSTYGFDRDVTEPTLRRIIREAGWREVIDVPGAATLYELP